MAEGVAHGAEKFVDDNKDKLTDGQQSTIRELVTELRAALESNNLDAVQEKVEALNAALQEIGTAMYQQQAAADAPPADGADAAEDDDVIEGEFTEG